MGELPWLAVLHARCHALLLGEAGPDPETPLGEDNRNLVPHVSWTLPNVPFSFADFNLYPFVLINCISSVSASIELWIDLGSLKPQEALDTSAERATAIGKSPLRLYETSRQQTKGFLLGVSHIGMADGLCG